jgi:hypothetical protein
MRTYRKEMKGYFSGSDDDEVQSKDEKPQEKAVSEAAVGGVNREKVDSEVTNSVNYLIVAKPFFDVLNISPFLPF